ncbi:MULTISPECIES: PAS domain-containing protein [unclassified Thermosipho (in: thermotogales)]|uniref:PAS domain-containing protein n=1 Tax=unclassified Thermosipho (in: thermotogales) TaxID=2676525 RepID=UPI000985D66C|nr:MULTISPECIES: PAS domain-containing protein [unclassified Thermosipho (in: thermotogales)]MBT1247157.1 hypothetical protein [Thermosipho sp. 1244]OOC47090.1 hypothetical protein XO09_03205 [Thermosipho sp. 1223]
MTEKNIWKTLWDYDPNGLVVVDNQLKIVLVNPAFCKMFNVTDNIIGNNLEEVIGSDISSCFKKVLTTNENIVGKQLYFSKQDLITTKVIFRIPDEGLIAGVFTDVTHEEKEREKKEKIMEETVEKVHQVIDHQMETAQKIASLLGENTAKTKAYLLKVLEVIREEK